MKDGVTMGLARVGGMCTNQHNCVIGELGVTNSMGKPYPSAGFTAVFVMAHEVGHNLGMYHDDTVSRGAIKIHNFHSWVHRVSTSCIKVIHCSKLVDVFYKVYEIELGWFHTHP